MTMAQIEDRKTEPTNAPDGRMPKPDGWKPFDWGPADRRFERFRRCPDLLRGEPT